MLSSHLSVTVRLTSASTGSSLPPFSARHDQSHNLGSLQLGLRHMPVMSLSTRQRCVFQNMKSRHRSQKSYMKSPTRANQAFTSLSIMFDQELPQTQPARIAQDSHSFTDLRKRLIARSLICYTGEVHYSAYVPTTVWSHLYLVRYDHFIIIYEPHDVGHGIYHEQSL